MNFSFLFVEEKKGANLYVSISVKIELDLISKWLENRQKLILKQVGYIDQKTNVDPILKRFNSS